MRYYVRVIGERWFCTGRGDQTPSRGAHWKPKELFPGLLPCLCQISPLEALGLGILAGDSEISWSLRCFVPVSAPGQHALCVMGYVPKLLDLMDMGYGPQVDMEIFFVLEAVSQGGGPPPQAVGVGSEGDSSTKAPEEPKRDCPGHEQF